MRRKLKVSEAFRRRFAGVSHSGIESRSMPQHGDRPEASGRRRRARWTSPLPRIGLELEAEGYGEAPEGFAGAGGRGHKAERGLPQGQGEEKREKMGLWRPVRRGFKVKTVIPRVVKCPSARCRWRMKKATAKGRRLRLRRTSRRCLCVSRTWTRRRAPCHGVRPPRP